MRGVGLKVDGEASFEPGCPNISLTDSTFPFCRGSPNLRLRTTHPGFSIVLLTGIPTTLAWSLCGIVVIIFGLTRSPEGSSHITPANMPHYR